MSDHELTCRCGHLQRQHPLYQDEQVCTVDGCECEGFLAIVFTEMIDLTKEYEIDFTLDRDQELRLAKPKDAAEQDTIAENQCLAYGQGQEAGYADGYGDCLAGNRPLYPPTPADKLPANPNPVIGFVRNRDAYVDSYIEGLRRDHLGQKERGDSLLVALDAAKREVQAVLDNIPSSQRIIVREGGGPENIYASLAVSVARLAHDLATAETEGGA